MKKVAIITGAGGEVGKVAVNVFLNGGYKVIATVRKDHDVKLFTPNEDLEVVVVDLLDAEGVKAFVVKAIEKYGRIDVSLMLAGGFAMGGLDSTNIEAVKEMFAINFETAFNLAQPLFQHMITQKEGGSFVFIGSKPALDTKAAKGKLAYALSKSLLTKLSEYINEEGASKNVHSYLLAPNTIDTPSNRSSMPNADYTKWVSPEEFSKMMLFLCSKTGNQLREGVFKMYGD